MAGGGGIWASAISALGLIWLAVNSVATNSKTRRILPTLTIQLLITIPLLLASSSFASSLKTMLVYLSGSDSFMAREAISKLKTKYLEKNPDGVELIEIDATEPMRNWADLKTVPLFATSRLIIIKRAGELPVDEQNNLASMLTDLPPSSVVVIWDGKPLKAKSPLSAQLEAATKTINTEPLAGSALRNWIKSQANEIGFEITEESVSELVDQYGSDLWG